MRRLEPLRSFSAVVRLQKLICAVCLSACMTQTAVTAYEPTPTRAPQSNGLEFPQVQRASEGYVVGKGALGSIGRVCEAGMDSSSSGSARGCGSADCKRPLLVGGVRSSLVESDGENATPFSRRPPVPLPEERAGISRWTPHWLPDALVSALLEEIRCAERP